RGGRDAGGAAAGGCRGLFRHRAPSPLAWRGVVTPAPTCGGAGDGRAGGRAPSSQRRSTRPVGVYGTQVRWRSRGQTGTARRCTGVALLCKGYARCLSMDEENHGSLKVTCANRNFSESPALRGKIHHLLILQYLRHICDLGRAFAVGLL